MDHYDLVVIGGGSAGMKAARTAARQGARVALAEQKELGGECFWGGCVPTKAMVRAAEVWHLVRRAAEFGIHAEIRSADFADAMAYKDRAVQSVGGGGEPDAGLSRIGVRYYPATAGFLDAHTLRLGRAEVTADRVVLAAGTIPLVPPVDGLLEAGYITNREAVNLTTLPRSLIVLGGGPIGLEFAQVFRRFGADVTVVEMAPQILPKEDTQIAELVTGYLRDEGIRVLTGARALAASCSDGCKTLAVACGGARQTHSADEILVATGRAAATGDLNLEAAGIEYSRKAVGCDDYLRTNLPHVWVAGDVAGGYLFTHVASFEGRLAAENAFSSEPERYDPQVVPRATFVDPEVASIGRTESEALESGLDIAVQSYSFADLDRARLYGDARGLVKLVLDARTRLIVGAHLVGPQAASLVSEIALAMQHRLPVSAIADTMHAYPTFPEAVEAAALSTPSYVGKVESDSDS